MKIKLRVLSVIVSLLFTISTMPAIIFAQTDGQIPLIEITDTELSGSTFTIKGTVSTIEESANLVLNVTKNGDDFASKNFAAKADGSFEVTFATDEAPLQIDDIYDFVISEAERTSTLSVVKEDNFSTDSSYTVKSTRDTTVGNNAPSMKIASGDERLLFTGSSSVITNDDSIYSVSVDVRLDATTSIDKQVFGISNSNGNGNAVNSDINKLGHAGFNAVKIRANNGNFIAELSDNAENQTEIITKQIGTYTSGSWTNIKADLCPESLELKLYVNGSRVLENETLYALAQNNYRRMFDTWNSGGLMYLDNLLITKTSFSKVLSLSPVSSSFTMYSEKTQNDLVAAVNGASEETVIEVLKDGAAVLDIDTSNLAGLSYDELSDVAAYIKSSDYTTISQIKTAYEYISLYIDVVTSEESELADKLSMHSDKLDLPDGNLYYTDSEIIGGIHSHLGEVSSPVELAEILTAYSVIYELKTIDLNILNTNYNYLTKFGLNGNYASLSPDSRNQIFDTMQSYTFDYALSYETILKGWAEEINELYTAAVIASFDYVTKNSGYDIVDTTLFLNGSVSPAVSYKFKASALADGEEKAYTEFVTNEDGTYECAIELPENDNDITYDICISPVEPEAQNKYYFFDTFTAGERIGNYIVNNNELYQTPYNGNPAPSMCVAREEGEERPRLLAGTGAVRDMTNGDTLFIEADIMKAHNIASPKLWSITDYNGNKEAMTVKATATDITLYYKDADEGFVTATLIKDFKKIHWYNIKFAVKMTEGKKAVIVFVDNAEVLSFNLSSDIPDIGRFFDSEALTKDSDIHYIDNIKCYVDTAYRINASEDYLTITAPGKTKIEEALGALNAADSSSYVSVFESYDDVFGIDTSLIESLKDTTTVDSNITIAQFKNVADVRALYYAECHLQQIKEADSSAKIGLLAQYQDDFGITVDTGNLQYEKFLIQNIADVAKSEDFAPFDSLLVLSSKLKNVTQMTVRDTIDANAAELENYGMSKSYKSLSTSERNPATLSLVINMPSTYNIDEFLSQVASVINSAISSGSSISKPSGGSGGGSTSAPSVGSVQVSPLPQAPAKEATFSDVSTSHWSYSAVETLSAKGIISGNGDGSYSPDRSVTREEFVKMVLTTLNQKLYSYEPTFTDVIEDMWHSSYVITAHKLGIINGKDDGSFGVGECISRQDAAVILFRCLDALSANCTPVRQSEIFDDDAIISPYAKDAVYHLYECNVINGMNSTSFAPLDSLSRAQAAKLLYEIIG